MSEEIVKNQYLLFEIGEEYAVDIGKVLEVIELIKLRYFTF